MTASIDHALVREYAAGTRTWQSLSDRMSYLDLLGALGELGLRPPMAPMTGPNVAARQFADRLIAEALESI